MNSSDLLAQLRDIHLPDPVSWWPPAVGWWLLLLAVVAVLGMAGHLLRGYLRRNRYRKEVGQELQRLVASRDNYSTGEILDQLTRLLRRVAIQTRGRTAVAPLVGESWLRFLDSEGGTDQFTMGPGRVLGEGLYRPQVEADLDQLLVLAEKWLRRRR